MKILLQYVEFDHSFRLTAPLLMLDECRYANQRFVLVHGAGMGSWCWFKIMSELKQQGFDAVGTDLAAAGIHPADANWVTITAQLTQPLVDLVANFIDKKNVSLCFDS